MVEVALHNTPGDCWSRIHDLVYGLTAFASKHPAGGSMFACGGDSTVVFRCRRLLS